MKPEKTDQFRTLEDVVSRLTDASKKEKVDPDQAESPARSSDEATSEDSGSPGSRS